MITNSGVAEVLGLSKSAVSMLRSGRRSPSIETMTLVEQHYDWTYAEQCLAKRDGTYAAQFRVKTGETKADAAKRAARKPQKPRKPRVTATESPAIPEGTATTEG